MTVIYPQTPPLIKALSRLRSRSTEDSTLAAREITRLLQEGADPNEASREGMTPLSFFYQDARASSAWAQGASGDGSDTYKMAAAQLIVCGADLMADDGAFLIKTYDEFNFGVLELIGLARKKGTTMSWSNNSNPLHALMSKQYPLEYKSLLKPDFMDLEWVSQARQSDGATPLHVLWSNQAVHYFLHNTHGNTPFAAQSYWKTTATMVDMGADLAAEDNVGNSVFDLIYAMIDHGMPGHEDYTTFSDRVAHEGLRRRLERNTGAGVSLRKPGRL